MSHQSPESALSTSSTASSSEKPRNEQGNRRLRRAEAKWLEKMPKKNNGKEHSED